MKKKKFKKAILLILPLLIAYYVISCYFVNSIFYYNSSKSFISNIIYAAIILTGLFIVIFTVSAFKCIKKNKTKNYLIFIFIIALFISGQLFVSINVNKISKSITKITDKTRSYSTSLVVLKSSNIKSISDLEEKTIGMIDDTNNMEGYVLANEMIEQKNIKKDNIKSYDSFINMLSDLYDSKIDAILISSSYVSMFSTEEGFEQIGKETKVIDSITKKEEKKVIADNTKTLTEPFTVLIMGVDSIAEDLAKSNSFNGDTLILMTFNPNTMNSTILSIPRDTRVPIVCTRYKSKNKINSSAYYGADCVIDTITGFTGIKIDYWFKINFRGVVQLVDALGGIDIDVPYAFCEQNSFRDFGKSTVYVEKGFQTLDGEKALAFARNRHPWPQYCGRKYSQYNSNDFIRGQNQQALIKAMTNKLKNINSLTEVYNLLDVAGKNLDTNIDKDTMMTGFDTFKNILLNSKNIKSEDFIGTQRLYLSGYDNTIDGIYYFEYYNGSLNDVVDAMKVNLELDEPKMDKEFSFSINSPYEDTQIGKGTYYK